MTLAFYLCFSTLTLNGMNLAFLSALQCFNVVCWKGHLAW